MRLVFAGADRTVTGSCHIVEVNGVRIVLDMGMYHGPRQQAQALNRWLPPGVLSADAVILSHSHLDHCGKLPVVVRAGFSGPIYCTEPTAAMTRIVLHDAAHIQQEDSEYLNRRQTDPGQPGIEPLYSPDDVERTLRLMRRVRYGQRVEIAPKTHFTLFDAGHILGSSWVLLEWEEASGTPRSLMYTADVGRYSTPIIRDPQPVERPVDYVITESTYGARQHAPMNSVAPQLLDAVRRCIQRRSRLLIPAFAVGRTQSVLWYLQRFIQNGDIPDIPLYVDSPMGSEVSDVHSRFPEYYDEETAGAIGKHDLFGTSRVNFVRTRQESKHVNSDHGPCVIIASSGTCEFGRILHHLKVSLERSQDMVLFVGFTPANTLGRRLQDGQKRVRIYGRWYDVACEVRTIHGLSAHADGDELLRFLAPATGPHTVFHVVHGEAEQADALAERLRAAGARHIVVPAMESAVTAW